MRAADLREHHDLVGALRVRGDVVQHRVGVRDLERVARLFRLDKHLGHHAVLDQHRIAPAALAKAQVGLVHQHAHAVGEFTVAVGNHGDVLGLLVLRPLVHHEGIVHGHAQDGVHALLGEHRRQFVVARQVGGRAGRRESAGQREDHDGLAVEQFGRGHVLPFIVLTHTEGDLGNALAFAGLQHR
ncbi:hypothetical protein D3C86_1322470 [compost metagenome]